MLEWINDITVGMMDAVLGWLLGLPALVGLLIVSIGTSAILTVVRLFTTNQDLLRRCDADTKRLKALMRQAKREGDKEALKRYRASNNLIAVKKFRAEGKPLLAALLPIALLATWCFQRLEFHPPQAGEQVEVLAYFPISAAGKVVHVVPQEHLTAHDGWVKEIVAVTNDGPPYGEARWNVSGPARPEPYDLQFRYDAGVYHKPLIIGRRIYSPSVTFYSDDGPVYSTEARMRQVKLLGIHMNWLQRVSLLGWEFGLPAWMILPPWLVAYLVIVIPFVVVLKRVLRIY